MRRLIQALAICVITGSAAAATEVDPLEPLLAERSLGAPDAPVTLVEFSSLTCPHCASFHRETLPLIKEAYVATGKVRLVYHDFPLDTLALGAAMVARCVENERYFEVLEALFRSQATWARSEKPLKDLESVAVGAGLTEADFRACLNNGKLMIGIRKQAEEASQAREIHSTPTFFVNDERVTGAADFTTFRAVIERRLAAAGPAPATAQ